MSDQFGNDGTGGFDWQTARINAEQAENERLHEELRLCIHVDKHIHITSGLNIEIERLRELLREMVDDKNTYLRPDWHKRVREALGNG